MAALAGVLSFGGAGQLVPGHWLGAVCGQDGMSVSSFYVLSFPGRVLGFWMQLEQRKDFSGPFLVISVLQLWSVMGVEAREESS